MKKNFILIYFAIIFCELLIINIKIVNATQPFCLNSQGDKTCINKSACLKCQNEGKNCVYDESTGDCFINLTSYGQSGYRCVTKYEYNYPYISDREEVREDSTIWWCTDNHSCHLIRNTSGQCVCANQCGGIPWECVTLPGNCNYLSGEGYSSNTPNCSNGHLDKVFTNNARLCANSSLSQLLNVYCYKCVEKTCDPEKETCDCENGYTKNKTASDCNNNSYYHSYVVNNSSGNFTCGKCETCSFSCESQGFFSNQNDCQKNINGENNGLNYSCHKVDAYDTCGNIKQNSCWKRKTCDEVSSVCHTMENCQAGRSFVIATGLCAGETETVCGTCCTSIAAPWFQTVNGNLFAFNNIVGKVGYDINSTTEATSDNKNDFINSFLARSAGNFDKSKKNSTSGIPIVANGTISNEDGYLTQRQNYFTKALNTKGLPYGRKENFSYFQALINYDKVSICNGADNPSGGVSLTDDSSQKICKVSGDFARIIDNYKIAKGTKQIVFVSGNLKIDLADNEKIQVEEGGYLAFIVSGTIIITADTGSPMIVQNGNTYSATSLLVNPTKNNDYSGYNQSPQIEGVFIGENIVFEGYTGVNNNDGMFAPNQFTRLACDKKLTLAGSFIGNNKLLMKRTFEGCATERILADTGVGRSNYPDYNEFNPVLTFVYRPDLVKNTPEWMKHIVQMKQEVN